MYIYINICIHKHCNDHHYSAGSIYAATKAAMDMLTKNLACEWAGDNIRKCFCLHYVLI